MWSSCGLEFCFHELGWYTTQSTTADLTGLQLSDLLLWYVPFADDSCTAGDTSEDYTVVSGLCCYWTVKFTFAEICPHLFSMHKTHSAKDPSVLTVWLNSHTPLLSHTAALERRLSLSYKHVSFCKALSFKVLWGSVFLMSLISLLLTSHEWCIILSWKRTPLKMKVWTCVCMHL